MAGSLLSTFTPLDTPRHTAITGCLGDYPDTKNTVSLEQRYMIIYYWVHDLSHSSKYSVGSSLGNRFGPPSSSADSALDHPGLVWAIGAGLFLVQVRKDAENEPNLSFLAQTVQKWQPVEVKWRRRRRRRRHHRNPLPRSVATRLVHGVGIKKRRHVIRKCFF
jgi:hypothetical protein